MDKINLKYYLILFVVLVNSGFKLYAEPFITIQQFWCEDKVVNSGINGFNVCMKVKKSYDIEIDKGFIYVNISNGGSSLFEKRVEIKADTVSLFFPYYMLNLNQGLRNLYIEIDPRYTLKKNNIEYFMTYIGVNNFSVDVEMPRIFKVQFKIDTLKVLETVDWENKGLPDLRYKLFYSTVKHQGNLVYESTVVKNSLFANWQTFSSAIYLSENDVFQICIEDEDNDFDTEISKYTFSLKDVLLPTFSEIKANEGVEKIKFSYQLLK